MFYTVKYHIEFDLNGLVNKYRSIYISTANLNNLSISAELGLFINTNHGKTRILIVSLTIIYFLQ